ncbi:MAG: MFS transporter [Acidobacteriota bacterium]
MKKHFFGWWVAFGSFTTLFTVVGMLYYGFPVFYPHLIESFGWSRADTMAGYAISTFVIGPIFGLSAGILIDRYGSKKIMLVGILMTGAALISFSLMQSLTHFYLFYFMHTIGYACAGPVPNQVLISQWFNRLRGRVMGVTYLGIGLGGTAAPLVVHYLVTNYGWRAAFQVLGVVILLIVFPLVLFLVKAKPSEKGLYPDGASEPPASTLSTGPSTDFTLREAIGTRAFWAICIGSFLSIASIGAVIQHLVLYLRDLGFSGENAAQILSILVISSLPGRIVMGYLSDIYPKKYVMLAAYLFVGLSVPLLFIADVFPAAYIFAFIFGFGMGADYMMIPLVTAESFGLSSMGKIMGAIFVTDTLGQALFPYVVGYIFDSTGNYQIAFWLVTAAALAGAVAILFIPGHQGSARVTLPVSEAAS